MEKKRWQDILHIVSGKNQKAVVDEHGEYPIYGSGGIIGYASDYLCEAGTTIIGRKGTINKLIYVNQRFWNVDTAFGITPGEKLNPKYLYYFCQYFNFTALDKSTTIPSLAKRDLLAIEMPVPSLEEQQRIVARIEELFSQLDDAEATLQKTKAQLALYRETVLSRAFSDIDTWTCLGNIADRVFDGPFGTNLMTADYVSTGIRVVRLENIKNAWFDDTKQSFVTKEKYETIKNHTVLPSDLLISTFISDSIKVCQLPEYIGFAVNKADCVGITLKKEINPRFIMYYLSTKQAYYEVSKQVHGATRPRINTRQIKDIKVPVGLKQQQNQIVVDIEAKLTLYAEATKLIDDSLLKLYSLKQSILSRIMKGEDT